jgi:hypothetical protein
MSVVRAAHIDRGVTVIRVGVLTSARQLASRVRHAQSAAANGGNQFQIDVAFVT